MTKDEAKKFVIDTILTGDKDKIARVIRRFQEVYGNQRSRGNKEDIRPESTMDLVEVAEKIFSEETE